MAAIIACIPAPVLGGAGIAMFGMVAANGIRVLSRVQYEGDNNFNLLIVGIELGNGSFVHGCSRNIQAFHWYLEHHFPQWYNDWQFNSYYLKCNSKRSKNNTHKEIKNKPPLVFKGGFLKG